jgi:hypothetical protein
MQARCYISVPLHAFVLVPASTKVQTLTGCRLVTNTEGVLDCHAGTLLHICAPPCYTYAPCIAHLCRERIGTITTTRLTTTRVLLVLDLILPVSARLAGAWAVLRVWRGPFSRHLSGAQGRERVAGAGAGGCVRGSRRGCCGSAALVEDISMRTRAYNRML